MPISLPVNQVIQIHPEEHSALNQAIQLQALATLSGKFFQDLQIIIKIIATIIPVQPGFLMHQKPTAAVLLPVQTAALIVAMRR